MSASVAVGMRGALLWLATTGVTFAGPADSFASASPPYVERIAYHGQQFLVRSFDPKKEDLQVFWKDDDGNLLRDFTGLEKYVSSQGEKLLFAANAGMFEPDSRPVGLLVQNENETEPLNLNDGQGNFYMKPNGVFLINEKHEAKVIESSDYQVLITPALWATQSGPLLVHGGDIHPDFIEDSKNLKIRSGVGVRKDGMVEFALSREPVNLFDFASLFRSRLKCPNALYLDGDISAFHVPGTKDPIPHSFGPMIGVVAPLK